MPVELLRSPRFSFAAFLFSKRYWCPLRLLCYRVLYPQADRKISPQDYLMFLLSLLSVAYTQFTYCLVSVALNTTTLSGLWREDSSVRMLRANCRSQTFIVTFRFWAETFHFRYTLEKSMSFQTLLKASGYCM